MACAFDELKHCHLEQRSLPKVLVRAAEQRFGKVPLLTDDEFDAQYRRIYQRARARGDASAEINLVSAALQNVVMCVPAVLQVATALMV